MSKLIINVNKVVTYLILTAVFIALKGNISLFLGKAFGPIYSYTKPPTSDEIADLILSNHIGSFKVSVEIRKNGLIYLESLFASWPIKLESNSKFQFLFRHEAMPRNCILKDKRIEVTLVECQ